MSYDTPVKKMKNKNKKKKRMEGKRKEVWKESEKISK